MTIHCHRGPNVEVPPVHERDLRDVEIHELRKQVQQLHLCVEHYKPFKRDDSHHSLKFESFNDEGDDVNPFHSARR